MKAFMHLSNTCHYERIERADWYADHAPALCTSAEEYIFADACMARDAMDEAQRILAEVEPDNSQTFNCGIERLQGAGRFDDRGRTHRDIGLVALAEALAQFVA